MSYSLSWLGTVANTVQFSKTTTTNNVDWAMRQIIAWLFPAKTTLAKFSFTIPASTPIGQKITLTFNNVKMIDAAGIELSGYNILK